MVAGSWCHARAIGSGRQQVLPWFRNHLHNATAQNMFHRSDVPAIAAGELGLPWRLSLEGHSKSYTCQDPNGGLQPNSNGLHPTSDGLYLLNILHLPRSKHIHSTKQCPCSVQGPDRSMHVGQDWQKLASHPTQNRVLQFLYIQLVLSCSFVRLFVQQKVHSN